MYVLIFSGIVHQQFDSFQLINVVGFIFSSMVLTAYSTPMYSLTIPVILGIFCAIAVRSFE